MNTNEPREPVSTEGGQFGDDDHVEVLVEDLFIEDYQTPLTLPPEQARGARQRGRVARVMRRSATSLIGGIAAIGGLVLATLFLTGRRRKVSGLSRLFHKLGLAR